MKSMVIGLEDLYISYFLPLKKRVAAHGSVDLELQHGEEEVLKEFVHFGVTRAGPNL